SAQDACSPSTAMRTRRPSSRTPRRPSRTRGSPAFPRSASSIRGPSTASSSGPPVDEQRAAGQLTMIEPCRTIELCDNRRQLDAKSPLVGPPAGGNDPIAPQRPPSRGGAGQRLDDQQPIAPARTLDQPLEQRVPCAVVSQLVEREGRQRHR